MKKIKTLINLVALCLFILPAHAKISITFSGNPPLVLSCQSETSISGYICAKDGQTIVISSPSWIQNYYSLAIDSSGRFTYPTVTKIEDDNNLLYQTEDYLWNDGVALTNAATSTTISGDLSSIATQTFALSSLSRNIHGPPSQQLTTFLTNAEQQLAERKSLLRSQFDQDLYNVHLKDDQNISCRRQGTREENEADTVLSGRLDYKVKCGLFDCGTDQFGNRRVLISSHDPSANFQQLLILSPRGILNNSPIERITIPDISTPISVNSSQFGNNLYVPFVNGDLTRESFVPSSLSDQSDFFKNILSPYYYPNMSEALRMCRNEDVAAIDRARDAFEERVSEANLVQLISMDNNILHGIFLPPENLPTNICRVGHTYFRQEVASLAQRLNASPVHRSISYDRALELFNAARAMTDIAWEYRADGCYARAHLMARRFEQMGVHVDKAWLKGDLQARAPDGSTVEWNFHVAPIVYIDNLPYVIDPSTFDRPVPASEWANTLSRTRVPVMNTRFPFPENSSAYFRASLAFSNSDPYLPYDNVNMTEEQKMTEANNTMRRYLGEL